MTNLTRTVWTAGVALAIAAPLSAGQRPPAAEVLTLAQAEGARGQRGAPPGPRARGPLQPLVTESFSRELPLGEKNGFELATGYGDITITGVGGDMVRIEAVKRVRHENRDTAREQLKAVSVSVTERGGLVEALTEISGRVPVFVDYTVSLPARASVSLKTVGGTIRMANVKGEIRVEAASGNVNITSAGRIRRAIAYAGNVTISGAEGEELIAETPGGTLQVSNVTTRTLELDSISGNIVVTDSRCDRCALKTVSGDIDFTGPLTRGGRYEMMSQSGSVRLTPTGPVSFDLEARTYGGGKLLSEFPLVPNTSVPTRDNILRGSYGENGAILSLTSFTGNVSVLRR